MMADEPTGTDNGAAGDDVGWWNCSLCTYKNAADKFKCEICDLRRGTSTRKPRCSTDTIVAQVMKQQEQIRQQTRVKPSPKSKTGPSTPTLGTSQHLPNDTARTKKSGQPQSSNQAVPHDSSTKKVIRAKNDDLDQSSEPGESSETEDSDGSQESASEGREASGRNKNSSKRRKQTASSASRKSKSNKKTRTVKANTDNSRDESDDDDDDIDSDSTSVASDALPDGQSPRIHGPGSESSMDDRSPYSSSSAMTPEPTTSSPNHSASLSGKQLQDNPFKNRPIEINGNLIKYTPPTSTGRTGLIIDKKRFTQHSVTVDDVTITFTEFATRQNKYIRKKKKRSRSSKAAATPATGVAEAD